MASTKSAVLVTVDIKPDRIDDFLKAMEDDVVKSRKEEDGCLRFDLLKDRENPNRFIFYEAYKDDDSAATHKTTPHYNSWAEFKSSGGVESQSVVKVETETIGDWAFQTQPAPAGPTPSAVLVTVDIKEDRIGDFLKAMEDDVTKSRNKELDPGCLRFDLLRDRANQNRFIFYEAYTDDDAAAAHKKTAHYKSWADFKATGGVEKQEVVKVETASIAGWAFQM